MKLLWTLVLGSMLTSLAAFGQSTSFEYRLRGGEMELWLKRALGVKALTSFDYEKHNGLKGEENVLVNLTFRQATIRDQRIYQNSAGYLMDFADELSGLAKDNPAAVADFLMNSKIFVKNFSVEVYGSDLGHIVNQVVLLVSLPELISTSKGMRFLEGEFNYKPVAHVRVVGSESTVELQPAQLFLGGVSLPKILDTIRLVGVMLKGDHSTSGFVQYSINWSLLGRNITNFSVLLENVPWLLEGLRWQLSGEQVDRLYHHNVRTEIFEKAFDLLDRLVQEPTSSEIENNFEMILRWTSYHRKKLPGVYQKRLNLVFEAAKRKYKGGQAESLFLLKKIFEVEPGAFDTRLTAVLSSSRSCRILSQ